MADFIKFSRTIKQIDLDNNTRLKLPEYCNKRISFYRYNKEEGVVEILCKQCGKAHKVLQPVQENDQWIWKDTHNETEYHFVSEVSGYNDICVSCKENRPKPVAENCSEKEGYTVFLTPKNKKYLRLRKVLEGKGISELINELIEKEAINKPLSLDL